MRNCTVTARFALVQVRSTVPSGRFLFCDDSISFWNPKLPGKLANSMPRPSNVTPLTRPPGGPFGPGKTRFAHSACALR